MIPTPLETTPDKKKVLPPRLTFSLFFFLCTLAGLLSLVDVLNLPPSESKNAFIANFSLVRLLTLGFLGGGTAAALGLFIKALTSPAWPTQLEEEIRAWHTAHPFLSSAYFCLSLAAILLLGSLELLMDAQRFPRMEPYIFLYVRLRPILLWLLAVAILSFALTLLHRWLAISPGDFLPHSRSGRLAAAGLGLVLVVNMAMWVDLLNDPVYFEDRSAFWMPVVYISIPLLFACLYLIDRQGRSKSG